ncbi:MAG: type II toxin-antitoxin system HicA family toxin [Candidatus Dadabacteria bacterium]|nr:type II toxin-antitoxin system HicA family toxin [Candidatus Dadabacteria bacterium]
MKVREIIKLIEKNGWYMVRHKGTNHRVFHHSTRKGIVIVSGNSGDEVPKGTLSAIKRQAGLK